MLAALAPVQATTTSGLFLDSCHAHCQGGSAATWSGAQGPQVGNTVIIHSIFIYKNIRTKFLVFFRSATIFCLYC